MQLAIDLTPRQAARVLEQALRAQAELEIEARNLPEGQPLPGKLTGREGDLLAVRIRGEERGVPTTTLIGAFCDVRTVLSGELYMFSTYARDVVEDADAARVLLAIPEAIQVMNRRQFERTNATVACQVRLWASGCNTPAVGLLANVSADGLACTLPGTALNDILVLGETVRVCFELAGFDGTFELWAIVCNKALIHDQQQLSLGLKFEAQASDPATQHVLSRLRAALCELTANFTDRNGEL